MPCDLEVSKLSDEWDELCNLVNDPDYRAPQFMLINLAGILRAIGEEEELGPE